MLHLHQPLAHIRPIRAWARRHAARLALDAETFRLEITRAAQTIGLLPRFAIRSPGGLAYSHHFGEHGMFIGWLPYDVKRWPVASDKLLFKQTCGEIGMPMPVHWTEGEPQTDDFIVKKKQGSFGQGMRGPFRKADFDPVAIRLAAGEYFEQFISGDCLKIWYWSGRPAAMERLPPRFVLGDGRRSIRAIAGAVRGSFDTAYAIDDACADILAWQGVTADSVAAEGQRILLDFRYVTPFDPPVAGDRDVLSQQSETMRAQVQQIGNSLLQFVPPELRQGTIFTIDAVADGQDALWLLEMNSHPMVHPRTYLPMLDDLFGVESDGLPANVEPAGRV